MKFARGNGSAIVASLLLLSSVFSSGCRQHLSEGNNPNGSESTQSPWGHIVTLHSNVGVIPYERGMGWHFLKMGEISFEPSTGVLEEKTSDGTWQVATSPDSAPPIQTGSPVVLGMFQRMTAMPWIIHPGILQRTQLLRLRVQKTNHPAAFFNHIVLLNSGLTLPQPMAPLALVEQGHFGSAMPLSLQNAQWSSTQIAEQRSSLADPILQGLPSYVEGQAPMPLDLNWGELETKALPLNYEKVILAGLHDPQPGFAYQNGQWFVTTQSLEMGQGKKEDRWFAPALKVGNEIRVPAPLSAHTDYVRNARGKMLPQWRLIWSAGEYTIEQKLSSQTLAGVPQIVSHFEVRRNPRAGLLPVNEGPAPVSLVFGVGRRPSVHFWDAWNHEDRSLNHIVLVPRLRQQGHFAITDSNGAVMLHSLRELNLLYSGTMESLVEIPLRDFSYASQAEIDVATPQRVTNINENNLFSTLTRQNYLQAQSDFELMWGRHLEGGAQVSLPSREWNNRVDAWTSQVLSIARVENRLNYGAYFYDMYFGVEEGWPVVAMAQWGHAAEAKAQAEIMLSPGNLDRTNYHHQYRNGLSSWYALEVARLVEDNDWLQRQMPTLIMNARWTMHARRQGDHDRSPLTRGLLPKHIYGGDVGTPAYSLYSNATCWRGLRETADALSSLTIGQVGPRAQLAQELTREASQYKSRLAEVGRAALNTSVTPAFFPLALEIGVSPSGGLGAPETPYDRLTEHPLGNYWTLFAPLLLHTDLLQEHNQDLSSRWITDYFENRGGLWGGLPRFNSGLDAVYAIGYIHELLERSKNDVRIRAKALAALESYMLHAGSTNGYAVPEVSGMFDMRFDRHQFENAVRSAPWTFGMYDGGAYLHGEVAITEPLAAGAGEGLWLLRKALVDETKSMDALPDGGLMLLSAVPADWLAEGQWIQLHRMPTAYGMIDLEVLSHIDSRGSVEVSFRKTTEGSKPLRNVTLRLIGPHGEGPASSPTYDLQLPISGAQRLVIPMRQARMAGT